MNPQRRESTKTERSFPCVIANETYAWPVLLRFDDYLDVWRQRNNPAITFTQAIVSAVMITSDTSSVEPHYAAVIRELIRRYGDEMKSGRRYDIETLHDDWCAYFRGGVCNCEPVCALVELSPPEFNDRASESDSVDRPTQMT